MAKQKIYNPNKNKAKKRNAARGKGALSKIAASVAAGFMMFQLYACGQKLNATGADASQLSPDTEIERVTGGNKSAAERSADYNASEATTVTFSPLGITVDGEGAEADGYNLFITEGGTYVLQGEGEGRITAKADVQTLHLVLNGLNLTGVDGAPLFIKKADTTITLENNTENTLTYKNGAQSGSLIIKNDCAINGAGRLTVRAETDGIVCGGALKIAGANVTVNAGNNAVAGGQFLMTGGSLSLFSGGSGIDCGEARMTGGTALITAGTASVSAKSFGVSGGLLLAAGGASAQTSMTADSLCSVQIAFPPCNAGTLVYVSDSSGEVIAAFQPAESFTNLTVSSPEFKKGQPYSVYTGGTAYGDGADGLFDSAEGGTLYKTFTVSGVLTTVGASTAG